MLDYMVRVLEQKDLTTAADLFNIEDDALRSDLSSMLDSVKRLTIQPSYTTDSNAQSIVELCLSRILSAIRSNDWIEENTAAIVSLLDLCLGFRLSIQRPKSNALVLETGQSTQLTFPLNRDVDSPHAKIAYDLLSCIFQFYEKRWVMKLSLPVATRFLLKDNSGLAKTVTSFLRLAAQPHAALLSREIPTLVQSVVVQRNIELLDTLISLYPHNKSAFSHEASFLLSFLPTTVPCSNHRILCLRLIILIGEENIAALESGIDQLLAAADQSTSSLVMPLIERLYQHRLDLFQGHIQRIRSHLDPNWPQCLPIILQLIIRLARLRPSLLSECVETIFMYLENVSRVEQIVSTLVALQDIAVFAGRWIEPYLERVQPYCYQLGSKGDTLLGNLRANATRNPDPCYASSNHNIPVGSYNPSESDTTSSGFQQDRSSSLGVQMESLSQQLLHQKPSPSKASLSVLSGRTSSSDRMYNQRHYRLVQLPPDNNEDGHIISNIACQKKRDNNCSSLESNTVLHSPSSLYGSTSRNRLSTAGSIHRSSDQPGHRTTNGYSEIASPSSVSLRDQDTPKNTDEACRLQSPYSVHGSDVANNSTINSRLGRDSQLSTGSVLSSDINRQYSKRDAMKQFNVKHFSKIIDFINNFRAHLPIPIHCSVQLQRGRHGGGRLHPQLLLSFVCARNSVNCLFVGNGNNCFVMKTKHCRLWIQVMLLAYQADTGTPLGQSSPRLAELSTVWNELVHCGLLPNKREARDFATVVNHSFPSAREQDIMLDELHQSRYFDIFEFNAAMNQWACFLCNHPDRAVDWMSEGLPRLAGTLKEKRGRLRYFKRWKTRYYTLSGSQFIYEKRPKQIYTENQPPSNNVSATSNRFIKYGTLSVSSIQSVRAIRRGNRDLPRAFEIFTQDRKCWMLKAVDGCDVGSWVKCLQIAVARNHSNQSALGVTHLSVTKPLGRAPSIPPSEVTSIIGSHPPPPELVSPIKDILSLNEGERMTRRPNRESNARCTSCTGGGGEESASNKPKQKTKRSSSCI